MKLTPSDLKQSALRTIEAAEPQRIDRDPGFGSFISFTYSSQEMHTVNGRTHVKSEQVRYENGRLTSERFEGQLPMAVYAQSAYDAQRLFSNQTLTLLKQFSSLLSLFMKTPGTKG